MDMTTTPASTVSDDRSFLRRRTRVLPVAALLAAVFLWGGSFPAMRLALGVMDPLSVMACRMWTALLLLLPFAGKLIPRDYRKGDWMRLLPMVLLQPCLYFLLESNALTLTTASQAGVISACVPVMVSVGSWLFLSEKLTGSMMVGLGASVAGVVGLTLGADAGGGGERPIVGNTLELAAMVCAAANMVLVKQLSSRYNPWSLTAMQVAAGAVFFLPGLSVFFTGQTIVGSWPLVLSILFLGGGVSLGAFGFYNWAMSRIPASQASVFINLVPVVAVALGWGLLGETLSRFQLAAAAMVIGGVWLSQAGSFRSRPAAR